MSIISLIGARGSGKTTVAKMLAARLNWNTLDLDKLFCDRHGCSIQNLVENQGWEQFRQMESQILLEAVTASKDVNTIIATGGGIVLKEANRKFLKENSHVCWLRAEAGILYKRLLLAPEVTQRPSLTDKPLEEEIKATLKEREALYRECSHQIIDGALPPDEICEKIISRLSQNNYSKNL